jgi:hypothetical protein
MPALVRLKWMLLGGTIACEQTTFQRVSIHTNYDDRFCKLGEDEDPSEEFEEYLACAVCGDNGEFRH